MNLPPVPGPVAPRSEDAVPPAPASPAPARARLILAGAVVAVGIVIAAANLLSPRPPDDNDVRAFVRRELARDGGKPDGVWVTDRDVAARTATYQVNAQTGRMEEARYAALVGGGRDSAESAALPEWLNLDLKALERCQKLGSGPKGARMCQLAALDAKDAALLRTTVVREVQPAGEHRSTISGTVTAERRGLRWHLAWKRAPGQSSELSTDAAGRPLTAFAGTVLVLDRATDKPRLIELAERVPALVPRLEQTIPALVAEEKAAALAILKPGAFFSGTATSRSGHGAKPVGVFVEITEVRNEDDGVKLTALLRNDGSWREIRVCAGQLGLADDGSLELALVPETTDGTDTPAGPFMTDFETGYELEQRDGQRVLPLKLEGSALTWVSETVSLRLEPGTADTRAAAAAESEAARLRKIDPVRPGRAYAGTLTYRLSGKIERWALRFVSLDENERAITAEIERLAPGPVHLTLTGEIETNPYRNTDGVITFSSWDGDLPEELKEVWSDLWPINLRSFGRRLELNGPKHLLRFERDTEQPRGVGSEKQPGSADKVRSGKG